MPDVLKTEKKTLLLLFKTLCNFIDDFILLIKEQPAQQRTLIVFYFNLYQMMPENIAKVRPFIQNFNLSQSLEYSTHMHKGLLDLGFDASNSNAVFFSTTSLQGALCFFFSKPDHVTPSQKRWAGLGIRWMWKKNHSKQRYLQAIAISKMNNCLFGLLLLPSFLDPPSYWKGPWNSRLYIKVFIILIQSKDWF